MTLTPGSWLSHYRIVTELGAGGMGEVYLAEDTRLNRKVAIKVLPAAVSSNPDRLQRFLREARATSALNHPNIVHIYEIGTADEREYLVLELVEGETLTRRVANEPLPLPQVVDLAIQLADALEEAHARGIIHRDLKPDNILITSRGQAKILDFGLAKIERVTTALDDTLTRSVTAEGTVMGTVEFMSPEQAMGKEADRRSDLFSLGVLLYRVASGRLPFTGSTPTEILGRIMHVPADPLQLTQHQGGTKFSAIIQKCVQKEPALRYQSATELLVELRAVQREVLLGDAAGPSKAGRLFRSRPRLWWALAAVTVLAMGTVAYRTTHAADPWIAVLPFENATGDPRLEYLASGLTESLIDDLSQVPRLHVISYTGVQSYRGKDPVDTGKRLHANFLLDGRLRNNAGAQAVHLTLVDASTGAQIWTHEYDRGMMPLIDVQQEIAREVSQRVAAGQSTARDRSRRGPAFAESYDLYLKGRYSVSLRTTESIKDGLQYLRDAIAKDPSYAPAYVGLARGYVNLAFTGTQPATYAFPLAMAAAEKALVVDPKLADAHCELGYLKAIAEYDWPAAEQEFTKALALNPRDAQSHELYAMWVLAPMGREVKAMSEVDYAVAQDPRSIMVGFHRGWILWEFRHPQDAVEQFEKTVAIDPRFVISHLAMSQALTDQNRFEEAIETADTPPYTPGGSSRQLTTLAYVMARAGDRKRLAPLLQEIEERVRQGYLPPFNVARIYAILGDLDRGFLFLERAYNERDPGLMSLKVDPTADVFRGDPRLGALLHKMHLQ